MRFSALVLGLVSIALPVLPASDGYPLWGNLEPGPYPIGIRIEYLADPSRVIRPETTLEGEPARESIDRRLSVATWYPATNRDATKAMTFGDYVYLRDHIYSANDRRHEGVLTEATRRDALRSLSTFGIFQGVPEREWQPLLKTPMRAVRDAVPSAGKFPLVLFAPGGFGSAFDSPLIAEYLASHGYVVLSASARGLDLLNTYTSGGAYFETQVRDLEYLIGYAGARPYIDRRTIGVIGFSRGTPAAVLLQMRNPTIDAVVDWDGSIGTKTAVDRMKESPFFDPSRVDVPFLRIFVGEKIQAPALFEELAHADTYVLSVAGIHHVDFGLGMVHTSLGARNRHVQSPPEHIRTAVESIHRFTRAFLDATLKGAVVDLSRTASALHPAGAFQFMSAAGRPALPSAALLLERLHQSDGIVSVRRIIDETRRREPGWIPFPEGVLTFLVSRFEELGRHTEMVPIAELNAALYPASARAWTLLGSAHEDAGDRAAALRSYRRALEINPEHAPASEAVKRLEANE